MHRQNDVFSPFKLAGNSISSMTDNKFLTPSTGRSSGALEKWMDDLEDQAAAMNKVLHDLDGPPVSPFGAIIPCVHHQPPSDCMTTGPGSVDDWILNSFRAKEMLLHSPRPKSVSSLPIVESSSSCLQCKAKSIQSQPASLQEDSSLFVEELAACPALGFLNFQISRLRVTQQSLERELSLRSKIISEQEATISRLRSTALHVGDTAGNRRSWDLSKFTFEDDNLLRELEAVRQKVLELEKRNVELDERCFRLELENDSLKRARGLPLEHLCK